MNRIAPDGLQSFVDDVELVPRSWTAATGCRRSSRARRRNAT